MASYPYISGAGNISSIIALLRKNFPNSVTTDTIKKYQLAPNNESSLLNVLQFLGLLDSESKKTETATKIFTMHSDDDFRAAFSELVKTSYNELFDLHGADAWKLERANLIGYFRQADKTSDIIGQRQAAVFQVLAGECGYLDASVDAKKPSQKSKASAPTKVAAVSKSEKAKAHPKVDVNPPTRNQVSDDDLTTRKVTLNVRIEVNLPPGAPPETYDAIFKSMRDHLLNE
jgi:hypothetical protein